MEETALPPRAERSDSSSGSSIDGHEVHEVHEGHDPEIQMPVPTRPPLPSRKSSGTLIVPRDSNQVGPIPTELEPGDVRAMSPRRTSEDLENMGREAREELHRQVTFVFV
jgi:short coiled-coil protein